MHILMLILILTTVIGVCVIFCFEVFRNIYRPSIYRNRMASLAGSPFTILSTWTSSQRVILVECLMSCAKEIRQDILLYPPKGTAQKPSRKGHKELYVYPWTVPELHGLRSYPSNRHRGRILKGFVPSNQGIVIYDEERNPVAQLIGENDLYILHEWGVQDLHAETQLLQWIIIEAKKASSMGAEAYAASCESTWKKLHDNSFDDASYQFFGDSLRNEIRAAEENRSTLSEEVDELQRFAETQAEIVMTRSNCLPGYHACQNELATEAAETWEQVQGVRKVQSVSLSAPVLSVFTEPLVCRDPRTRKSHRIGRFRIDIMLDGSNGCVRWYNQDNPTDLLQAPGVHASGHAFVGNTTTLFPELIGKGEIQKVVKAAIRYVERVSSGDEAADNVECFPELES